MHFVFLSERSRLFQAVTLLRAFRKFTLSLLFILLLTVSASSMAQDLIGSVQFTETSYRIGPGDVLSFHVYNQPDLTQKNILVRSDGMASFNSVGELPVRDHSIGDIQRMLELSVGELIKNPIVTVTVSRTKPGTIYLSGAVKKPGMYQLSTGNQNSSGSATSSNPIARIDLRVSNILANAGGIKMSADLSQIQIKRQEGGQEVSMTIDLWKMLKHGDASEDRMLQSGDSIYIPTLPSMAMSNADYNLVLTSSIGPTQFPVRIIGELQKPGIYQLNGTSPYLNSAIAMAAGFNISANKKVIAIRRFTSETDVSTFYVDPSKSDILLRPNDIVYVSPKKMYKTGRFFDNVQKVLSPFTNASFSAGVLNSF